MNLLNQTLKNKNWREAAYIEDEDGFVEYDETESYPYEDVRKFVTMDGHIYQFVKVQHGMLWRIWYDLLAWIKSTRTH